MTTPADMSSLSSGPRAGFVVSRDDVLRVRATLLAEIDDFRDFLQRIRRELSMGLCGGDPVSADVAKAVTTITVADPESYYATCEKWVGNLEQAAHALELVARQYGYTDDEIARATPTGPQ